MTTRYLEHRAFPGSLQARMMIFFARAGVFFCDRRPELDFVFPQVNYGKLKYGESKLVVNFI
jgi:hypothetical protein